MTKVAFGVGIHQPLQIAHCWRSGRPQCVRHKPVGLRCLESSKSQTTAKIRWPSRVHRGRAPGSRRVINSYVIFTRIEILSAAIRSLSLFQTPLFQRDDLRGSRQRNGLWRRQHGFQSLERFVSNYRESGFGCGYSQTDGLNLSAACCQFAALISGRRPYSFSALMNRRNPSMSSSGCFGNSSADAAK